MSKAPRFQPVEKVLARCEWAKEILLHHAGAEVDLGLAKRLAIQFNTASDDTMPYPALFNTFVQYEGSKLTPEFISVLGMQIAEREAELKDGALLLYTTPVREEWVTIEIISLSPAPWREDSAGQELELLALGGHPSGHTLRKIVPEGWLSYLAYQDRLLQDPSLPRRAMDDDRTATAKPTWSLTLSPRSSSSRTGPWTPSSRPTTPTSSSTGCGSSTTAASKIPSAHSSTSTIAMSARKGATDVRERFTE